MGHFHNKAFSEYESRFLLLYATSAMTPLLLRDKTTSSPRERQLPP